MGVVQPSANVLQLRAFAEPGASVHVALLVHGHPAPFNAIFHSDCRPLAPCDQNFPSDGFLVYVAFSGNLTDFHLGTGRSAPRRAQPGLHSFAETYEQLQEFQSWPDQDVISRVNALASATVLLLSPQLLPIPFSEVPGILSLDKASCFLGLLERVLAEETSLEPAALLAILHFLKRVTALRAEEPEPQTKLWEEFGRGFMFVASLVLEER
ncbi:hypothetical protein U0070_016530 [Myodes glareolus]|uniref:Uncharacterized protein n=1 Tax=Myodes glareolus TaxID=447135 RepID=A0AAW0H9X5_MYOGA